MSCANTMGGKYFKGTTTDQVCKELDDGHWLYAGNTIVGKFGIWEVRSFYSNPKESITEEEFLEVFKKSCEELIRMAAE